MKCRDLFQKAWQRFLVFFLLITICSVLYQNTRRALYATSELPIENLTKYDVDKVKKLIDVHVKADLLISLLHAGREIHTIDIDSELFGEEAYTDVWGKCLVITQVHSKDADGSTAFGVFSKGPDGVSLSNGNDADDISSWASVDNAFWRAAHREAFVLRWGKRIAWAGVLTMSTSVLLALYHRYAKERRGTSGAWSSVPLQRSPFEERVRGTSTFECVCRRNGELDFMVPEVSISVSAQFRPIVTRLDLEHQLNSGRLVLLFLGFDWDGGARRAFHAATTLENSLQSRDISAGIICLGCFSQIAQISCEISKFVSVFYGSFVFLLIDRNETILGHSIPRGSLEEIVEILLEFLENTVPE